jgi:crotonobetainyl-CoA hydratase
VHFRDDPELRVAIITGAGERFFSAGWDMKVGAQTGEIPDQRPGGPYGAGGFAGITELPRLYKPVIAAVNGLAIGGGFEIALACDIVIAAENAEFAVPEVLHGVLADAGGIQRLARRMPYSVAMELLLTGRRMSASTAERWGFVNAVVPSPMLMSAAREMAAQVAAAAPLAIQAVKQVVTEGAGMSVAEVFVAMRQGQFDLVDRARNSADAREGPRAFAERRPPRFEGR